MPLGWSAVPPSVPKNRRRPTRIKRALHRGVEHATSNSAPVRRTSSEEDVRRSLLVPEGPCSSTLASRPKALRRPHPRPPEGSHARPVGPRVPPRRWSRCIRTGPRAPRCCHRGRDVAVASRGFASHRSSAELAFDGTRLARLRAVGSCVAGRASLDDFHRPGPERPCLLRHPLRYPLHSAVRPAHWW
jgi:hypothetical protein